MRNPNDPHYGRRLSASYLASLLFHALLAALLFTVAATTSEEGATEQVTGAEVISVTSLAPVVKASVAPTAAPPQPAAPKIAPLKHAPLAIAAHQPLPPQRHVLSQFKPTAPPNPTPLPQASLQPAPQPTQAVLETHPSNDIAAVPVPIPSAATIAIARRAAPTAAPSPKPTARPTPKPPTPTAAPSRAPQTPAPVPSAQPSPKPSASPMPAPQRSAKPRATPGVPSPSPTRVPAPSKVAGPAPSPGPKGAHLPGAHAGESHRAVHAAPRPIQVKPSPRPVSSKPNGSGINARLRALLPHNAVNPTMKTYAQDVSLRGKINPTPPPDVLAKTKYILDSSSASDAREVKMWVTSVSHRGPLTFCTGWLVRYPHVQRVDPSQVAGPTNASHIGPNAVVFGGSKPPWSGSAAGLAPIIEADATTLCSMRILTPFSPASPSP